MPLSQGGWHWRVTFWTHPTRTAEEESVERPWETGLPYSIAFGKPYQGWLLTHRGIANEGIAMLLQCLNTLRAMGAGLQLPYALFVIADAFQKSGRIEEGLSS